MNAIIRSLAILLCFSIVLFAPVCRADSTDVALDVKEGEWYTEFVKYIVEAELMDNTSSNVFKPNASTTRAVIVEALYRIEGEPATLSSNSFSDVKKTDGYYNAVIWASENGIVYGYGNGKFGPDDDVTREQLVTIIYRYCELKCLDTSMRKDLSVFSDAATVSSFARESMCWATAEEIIIGEPNGRLNPRGDVLRSQTAAILYRLIKNYGLLIAQEVKPSNSDAKVGGTTINGSKDSTASENNTSEPPSDNTQHIGTNNPRFVVSNAAGKPGEKVSVTISAVNNPGIASIGMTVEFDERLILESASYSKEIGGKVFGAPVVDNNRIKLIWLNPFENLSGDWVFATLIFTVPSKADSKEYKLSLSYDADDVFDIYEENVFFECVNGSIKVS